MLKIQKLIKKPQNLTVNRQTYPRGQIGTSIQDQMLRRPGHFIYTLVEPAETGYLSNQITGLLSLLQSAED